MKPRFEPDTDSCTDASQREVLVGSEAYDASEQQFAASLGEKPRFVVEESCQVAQNVVPDVTAEPRQECSRGLEAQVSAAEGRSSPAPDPGDSWRQEVAARVNRYRSRRRQPAPRYPSLQLKFESTESWSDSREPAQTPAAAPASRLAVAAQDAVPLPIEAPQATSTAPVAMDPTDAGGKLIEFPRSSAPPPTLWDELAEPLFDRPRILEAPEILPPPPALGGILIEAAQESVTEKRPGFELPLQSAPLLRRLLAAALDLVLVLLAFTLFAYTFFRMTGIVPPLRQALGVSAALMAVFWVGYQYLLLVCAGTTPGLKVARLRLSRFDGNAVSRNLRRWRVATSLLSGFSLALGYAWCFFDEDELCWHDRITRTYLEPKPHNQDSQAALPRSANIIV